MKLKHNKQTLFISQETQLPDIFSIGSMYGIFTYIWLICMVHVGKYTSPMDPMGL